MEKKATSGIMLTLLAISILALAFNIQPVKAEPKTWYVDDSGGKDFTRIQDAVNAASAGDTIFVYNGIYYEHIFIFSSRTALTLTGESKYDTIIDGSEYGPIVTIYASDATFAHFTVRNAGWMNWNANGITLRRTQSSQVTDCIVSGCAYGIREIREIGTGGNNIISGNTVSDATEIAIGSTHATSIGNIVANNTVTNSTNGIYFNSPYNLQIVGNHVFGTESRYSQYGIHLQVGGLNNAIIGNRVEYSENAIRLDYADSNLVQENAVENCIFGVFVGYESSDNIVARNNASGSIIGIMLWDNSNNNLVMNNLVMSNYYGIALSSSADNRIYHNNFMTNTQQVLSDGLSNVWDSGYPSGGNYWSDYEDVDLYSGPNQDIPGSDGIWDHPYIIYTDRDRYPFVNPRDNTPPIANAGPDQTVQEDTLVTLDGSGSTDNVGIASYAWTFNDATPKTLTGANPTYAFTTPGAYTVTLNVTDATGNWAIDTVIITVLQLTPEELIQRLIETIQTSNIPKGTASSLTSKLEDALHLLDIGNENGATHKLMEFTSQVEALRGKKISNEQANYLIYQAQKIIDRIKA